MTDKEWEEKLEPFAKILYEIYVGLNTQTKKLEEKILKDFGAVEVYISVVENGVRMLISPTKTERVSLRFKFKE